MRRLLFLGSSFALAAASVFAQAPAIGTGGVLPAATYTPEGLPSSGIAQGSFFTIFGTNMGPATPATPTGGVAIPTTLGGTSVAVTVGGTTTAALLFFVSPDQINAVLPSPTPVGVGTIVVTYNNVPSASAPITVVASSFGSFTQNSVGTGPADAQDFNQNSQLTTLIHTAKPGDTEILYGTGLGPNPMGDQNSTGGAFSGNDLRGSNFQLYVGGVLATVGYAGRSAYVGEDQINFTIPSGVSGCYVPVVVVINGVVGNFGSISIDPNGNVCSDPYGLTPAQISSAASGQLSVASILLTRLSLTVPFLGATITLTEDDAVGRFYQYNGAAGASPLNNSDFVGISSYGSCTVATCANTSTCVPTSKGLAAIPKLNAGSALSVSGGGTTVSLPLDTNGDGFYSANIGSSPLMLPGFTTVLSFFNPGTFTVTGPGGPGIPSFTASVNVPAPLALTTTPVVNATTALDRTQDLTFNYSGVSSGWVLMSVSSATKTNTIPAGQYNSATVTCLQQASAGTFTIPSYLLQALPKSDTLSIASTVTLPTGAVLIAPFNLSTTFTGGANVNLANSIVSSGVNTTVN